VPHQDPLKRAHVKIWADHCTERIQKAYYVALMNQDPSGQQVCMFTMFFDAVRVLLWEDLCYSSVRIPHFVHTLLAPSWNIDVEN
jgi:hypothetical protein